jgi:hypothetical protein
MASEGECSLRPSGLTVEIATSCWGSRTGNDPTMSALIRLKIEVLAPIPSARESTATIVTAGLFHEHADGVADIL